MKIKKEIVGGLKSNGKPQKINFKKPLNFKSIENMKKYLLSFLFIVGAITISNAYPDCMLEISNTTAVGIVVGVQTVDNTPNECGPMSFVDSFDTFIPATTSTSIFLGTAVIPDPPIRPFRIGCYDPSDPSTATWQINTCWNPACVESDGTFFNIEFVYCGDYLTKVIIS